VWLPVSEGVLGKCCVIEQGENHSSNKKVNKLQTCFMYVTLHSSLTAKANVVRLLQSLWKNPCQESNLME